MLTVREPAEHTIAGRMVRQTQRHATPSVHHVDVPPAVILPGKGDVPAVRRELGPCFRSRVAGDAPGITALARDQPQIALVREDDFVLVHVSVTHQVTLGPRRTPTRKNRCQNDCFPHYALQHDIAPF